MRRRPAPWSRWCAAVGPARGGGDWPAWRGAGDRAGRCRLRGRRGRRWPRTRRRHRRAWAEHLDRAAGGRPVRGAGHQPSPRPRRALVALAGQGLLHDRVLRPRGQRGRGGGAASDRPGDAALPVGRLLRRAGAAGAGHRRRPRRAARPGRRRRRPDLRRAAQGVRPATSSRSSRRPRRSPRTCRAPSASRSRSTAPPSSAWRAPWPADAVVVASFGDASANHSTAAGAINAAVQVSSRGIPVPLLLVCEDNGLGISVPTPPGWVEQAYGHRPGLRYLAVDGSDLVACVEAATELAGWVRGRRRPAFLHLRTVRLMGHAGSDLESAYRRPAEIAADLARDPVLATARLLVGSGTLTAEEVLARYEEVGARVRAVAQEVADVPRLTSAEAVMAPIAPRRPDRVARAAAVAAPPERRLEVFGGELPEDAGPMTFAQQVNRTLLDLLAGDPGVLVFGEDVAAQGRGLRRHPRAAAPDRPGPGVRHPARRADGPRARARRGAVRAAAGAGDPVPGLPAQRRGPAARRGGHAAVLLRRPVPQPDGRAGRRLRLPEGLRRALPQRQRRRGAARRPGPGGGLALAPRRRRGDAAHLRRRRTGRRHPVGVPRADRAVPLDRPARGRRRALDRALRRPGRVGRGARADRLGAHARRRAPTSPSSPSATACR